MGEGAGEGEGESESEGGQDQQRAVDGEAPGLQLPLRQPGLTGAPALRAKSCWRRARSCRTARKGSPRRASVRISCSSEPVKYEADRGSSRLTRIRDQRDHSGRSIAFCWESKDVWDLLARLHGRCFRRRQPQRATSPMNLIHRDGGPNRLIKQPAKNKLRQQQIEKMDQPFLHLLDFSKGC